MMKVPDTTVKTTRNHLRQILSTFINLLQRVALQRQLKDDFGRSVKIKSLAPLSMTYHNSPCASALIIPELCSVVSQFIVLKRYFRVLPKIGDSVPFTASLPALSASRHNLVALSLRN